MSKIVKDAYGKDYPLSIALRQVGKGWAEIVTKCYNACAEYDIVIIQIKEKVGELRFYVIDSIEEVDMIIEQAEEDSCYICEDCGRKGRLHEKNGWLKTLCGFCNKISKR